MKKIILALVVLLGLGTYANAQEAGKYWVGGALSFSSTKEKVSDVSETVTNYSVIPEFGYVLNDRLGIGLQIGFSHRESANYGYWDNNVSVLGDNVKMNGYTINPFVRYSFLKGSFGSLFFDGGVGYSHYKQKDSERKDTALEIGIRPGVAVNVSENIRLFGRFGFLGYQNNEEKGYLAEILNRKTNSFKFDLEMRQIQLGMNLVF